MLPHRTSVPNYKTSSKSKTWCANYKIGETCWKRQWFCIELQKISCGGDTVKIWCNSVLYILWGRKGKPFDVGDSLRWCGEHTLIFPHGSQPLPLPLREICFLFSFNHWLLLMFFYTGLWIVQAWSIIYTLHFRHGLIHNIVFIRLYLVLAYLKRLI